MPDSSAGVLGHWLYLTGGKPLEPRKQVAKHMDQQSKATGTEEEDGFMKSLTQHSNESTHKAPQALVNPQTARMVPTGCGKGSASAGQHRVSGVITMKSALTVERKGL